MPRNIRKSVALSRRLVTAEGPIDYILKRSTRRTLGVTITEKAEVFVGAPWAVLERDIERFLHDKARWIVRSVQKMFERYRAIQQKNYGEGSQFLFLGKKYPLQFLPSLSARGQIFFAGDRWDIVLPLASEERDLQAKVRKLLVGWYRQQAEEVLGSRVFYWARAVGATPKHLAVRTQKRVWGNCEYRSQTIHLNWQIIFAPPEVMDYVIVHELCHLLVPNHSRRFWRKVEIVMPNFKEHKAWLRHHSVDMILP